MKYNEVVSALSGKKTVNAYVNGTDRVRIVGVTAKMVKINTYNGASIVKNDKDNYIVKNVRPDSISLTKEKVTKTSNKPKGVFQVVKNETVVKDDLSWEKARELYKKESTKGTENDVFAIFKMTDGERAEKPSISKTIKKKVAKSRTNNYVVRVEGTNVSELGGFAETLVIFKTKVVDLETAEEFGTDVKMIKIGKDDIETTSRETVITEPVVEEVKATEPVSEVQDETEATDEQVAA